MKYNSELFLVDLFQTFVRRLGGGYYFLLVGTTSCSGNYHNRRGVLFYRDINWFEKDIFRGADGTGEPAFTHKRYFHTAQLTLSYRLFGNTP